jgi:hypothetical protein
MPGLASQVANLLTLADSLYEYKRFVELYAVMPARLDVSCVSMFLGDYLCLFLVSFSSSRTSATIN